MTQCSRVMVRGKGKGRRGKGGGVGFRTVPRCDCVGGDDVTNMSLDKLRIASVVREIYIYSDNKP